MRRSMTLVFLTLIGLHACSGGSETPESDAPANAQVTGATDPDAPAARIVSIGEAPDANTWTVGLKVEKGAFGSGAIELLTPEGKKVPGAITLSAGVDAVTAGNTAQVTLTLSEGVPPWGASISTPPKPAPTEEADKTHAPPAAEHAKPPGQPKDKASLPVQFACKLGERNLTTTARQGFSMGPGNELAYLGETNRDLLSHMSTDAQGNTSYANTPSTGSRQVIDLRNPDEPVTLVLVLGSPFKDDASKALTLTLAIKGITKAALSNLPLTVPVIESTVAMKAAPQAPGAEAVAQLAYDVHYVGTGGEVVIDAVDFASRSIRGTFRADLKFETVAGKGEKLFGDTLTISDGRFDIPAP